MSYSASEVALPQPTVARSVRRYVFWALSILLLGFIVFVALVRTTILPPGSVLSYQFGFSPKPLLGEASVDFTGWGWYPIKAELNSSGTAQQVTFVRFLPLNEPEKNPITVFHRVEVFPDDLFLRKRNFPMARQNSSSQVFFQISKYISRGYEITNFLLQRRMMLSY